MPFLPFPDAGLCYSHLYKLPESHGKERDILSADYQDDGEPATDITLVTGRIMRGAVDVNVDNMVAEEEEDRGFLLHTLTAELGIAVVEESSTTTVTTATTNVTEVRPSLARRERDSSMEGMAYLAGYIAFRGHKFDPTLGVRTHQSSSTCTDTWIDVLSKGGLFKPAAWWLDTIREFEVVFWALHGNAASKVTRVIGRLRNMLEKRFPHVHPAVVRLYARTRTFIRIRHLNGQLRKCKGRSRGDVKKARKWAQSSRLSCGAGQ